MSQSVTYPKLKFPLTEDQVNSLQEWIDQMRMLLQQRLSFATNFDASVIDFEFQSGTAPTQPSGTVVRPLGVILLSLQKIVPATNTAPTVADGFSWQWANGTLTFPSLGTLASGSRYRARILVVRS